VWLNTLFYLQDCLYHTCKYNRLPEDEATDLKPVEDIQKIKYQNINLEKVQLYCIKKEGRINYSLGDWLDRDGQKGGFHRQWCPWWKKSAYNENTTFRNCLKCKLPNNNIHTTTALHTLHEFCT